MSFGKWLSQTRQGKRISGVELEKRSGVSRQYISNLERELLSDKTQMPIKPSVEVVEKLAKALRVPLDEARLAAGYAPNSMTSGKPQTLSELLEILEHLGVENIHFADDDRLRNASPEDLQNVLDAVKLAIEVTLNRQRKTDAPTETRNALRK